LKVSTMPEKMVEVARAAAEAPSDKLTMQPLSRGIHQEQQLAFTLVMTSEICGHKPRKVGSKNPRILGWIDSFTKSIMLVSCRKENKMILLHFEHTTLNFDAWKASFDSYAELRQTSGARRYRVSRPIDNPNFAMIDLEFESLREAESLLAAVQQVWQRVGGTMIKDPQWRIAEVVETKELQPSNS
jgi:hypothetical protein